MWRNQILERLNRRVGETSEKLHDLKTLAYFRDKPIDQVNKQERLTSTKILILHLR